jgi:hypothetical protein
MEIPFVPFDLLSISFLRVVISAILYENNRHSSLYSKTVTVEHKVYIRLAKLHSVTKENKKFSHDLIEHMVERYFL